MIDAWALETGQQAHPKEHPQGSPPTGDDGVPVGQPNNGTATMLAIEAARGGKTPTKGSARVSKAAVGAKKSPGGKKKGGR